MPAPATAPTPTMNRITRRVAPMVACALALCILALATWTTPCAAETGGRVRLVPFGTEEMVFIRLPGGVFSWPKSQLLGGPEPRIILDFSGVEDWDEAYVPDGGGHIVRRIRTYLHQKEKRLRVVLDLAGKPDDYAITLGYETRLHGSEITVSAIPLRKQR